MNDLFSNSQTINSDNVSRTERQKLGVQKWVDNKMKGTLVYATGVGKTYTAVLAIKRFLSKNPGKKVLVVVPTDPLFKQWNKELKEHGIDMWCIVKIINTIVKHDWVCDLLVLDEIHGYASHLFGQVFQRVKYKIILGLTATLTRLDGKDSYIRQFCPVVDEIPLEVALENNWLSPYREYKVIVNVDLTEYIIADREFKEHFSFFNNDFTLAMACMSDWKKRAALSKEMYTGNDPKQRSAMNKVILAHAAGFSRTLQKRKAFIYNHPKKIELTNLILEHRMDKKCITFSPSIPVAEQIKYGTVYHSKQTKKKRTQIMEEFRPLSTGILNTAKALDEGADIPGLSVAVILSNSSSDRQKTQRIGRVIRKAENKVAEIFTLVLKGTVEEEWFRRSSGTNTYVTVSDDDLINLLKGLPFNIKANKSTGLKFRF